MSWPVVVAYSRGFFLAIFIILAILAPLGASDIGALAAILTVAFGALIGVFLNRGGHVTTAGSILIVLVTLGVMGSIGRFCSAWGLIAFLPTISL